MKRCYISMTSLTYAQKAGKVLAKEGFSPQITRMPQKYAQNGCAFGLVFDNKETAGRATLILDTSAIPYGKVIVTEYE